MLTPGQRQLAPFTGGDVGPAALMVMPVLVPSAAAKVGLDGPGAENGAVKVRASPIGGRNIVDADGRGRETTRQRDCPLPIELRLVSSC